MRHHWGIDLGGTKIEGVVLDKDHQVLVRHRVPTEAEKGYQHILHQVKACIDSMQQTTGLQVTQVGMGAPGSIDAVTGLQKNSNTMVLIGKPMKADLQDILGVPVLLTNDANCFAVAEVKMGALRSDTKARIVFGVIMGTGVGGGIVIDGVVHEGQHRIAGEWGHSILDIDGPTCYCGKHGCVEKYIAGPALERYYADISGEHKKLRDIVDSAKKGDKHAAATLDRLVDYFGRAMSNVVNILDPDVIVLGGGVSNVDVLYTKGVKAVEKYTFNGVLNTPIIKAELGDSAGVFGAALL